MKDFGVLTKSVLLAGMVALTACGGDDKSTSTEIAVSEEKEEAIPVTTEKIKTQDVAQIEELTATVKAYAENDIASQSPGRIVKIYTEVGNYVKKGQLLVKMDPTSLLQTKTQLVNQEADYKRTLALMQAGGASQQEVDQLKTQLDVTRETYKNLLENVNLVAPISGVVTARNYDNEDLYQGGEAILNIAQIQPVKIKVNVSEQNFTKIKKGQKVNITLDTYEGQKFTGTVSIIYPTIDATSRTFPVELQIANPNNKIRPGMFARATFDLGNAKHILVPAVSVQKQMGSGDHYVYIAKDGQALYKKVVLGRRLTDKYEIVSGLENGDEVITSGMSSLSDQKPIVIKGSDEASKTDSTKASTQGDKVAAKDTSKIQTKK